MNRAKDVSRREFTEKSALALLSGVVITISGCGDSGYSASPSQPATTTTAAPTTDPTGDIFGVVSANHGHIAQITRAVVTAGNDLSLDISGEAGHPHTVELSAAELMQIGNGVRVAKAASTFQEDPLYPEVGTHTHDVAFN